MDYRATIGSVDSGANLLESGREQAQGSSQGCLVRKSSTFLVYLVQTFGACG